MDIYNESLFTKYLEELFNKMEINAQVETIEKGVIIVYNDTILVLNTSYNKIKKIKKTIDK